MTVLAAWIEEAPATKKERERENRRDISISPPPPFRENEIRSRPFFVPIPLALPCHQRKPLPLSPPSYTSRQFPEMIIFLLSIPPPSPFLPANLSQERGEREQQVSVSSTSLFPLQEEEEGVQ